MTGRTRAKESENVKFKNQFHEISQSINLAASPASGDAGNKYFC